MVQVYVIWREYAHIADQALDDSGQIMCSKRALGRFGHAQLREEDVHEHTARLEGLLWNSGTMIDCAAEIKVYQV